MGTKDQRSKKRLPYGAAKKIAKATGYSLSHVRAVRQGRSENGDIERLLYLAFEDRLTFAQELKRCHEATKLINQLGQA